MGNSPGAARAIRKFALTAGMFCGLTVTVCWPGARSGGTCRLICVGEAKYSGRKLVPICTVVPASVCTSGLDGPMAAVVARLTPKMEATEPAATLCCGVRPAALFRAGDEIYGTALSCATTLRGTVMTNVPDGAVPDRSPVQLEN